MDNFISMILSLVASFLAVAIVLTLHEFSHAYVAYKCGDPTPKWNGRLTLNPFAHFDVLGLILFAFAGFGWAKPVPINPNNFRHYKSGLAFTAVAGVVMNYLSVIVFYPLFLLVTYYVHTPFALLNSFLSEFTCYLWLYSLSFCVFNLIPLPPLDGWRLVEALNRRRGKLFRFFQRYGGIILIILIGIHFLASYIGDLALSYPSLDIAAMIFGYIDILGYIMTYVTNWIGWPIMRLWELIFFHA